MGQRIRDIWRWFLGLFKRKPVSKVVEGWSEPIESPTALERSKKRHFIAQARGSKTNITKGAFGKPKYGRE